MHPRMRLAGCAAAIFAWASPALAATTDGDEFVTELRWRPEGWLAVGGIVLLAALCWAIVWMYRHEARLGSSLRLRTALAVVRCATVVVLAFILLEPVRVRILRKWVESYTVVLVDNSSSMDLGDLYRDGQARERVRAVQQSEPAGPVRRADLVETVLSSENGLIAGLARNNRVKLYTFDTDPEWRTTVRASWDRQDKNADSLSLVDPTEAPTSFAATGAATNIDRAVRRSLESIGGSPLGAVVVLSDGGFNQGASVSATARFAREREIPVHVIGVGDPASPRNVRVVEVLAPDNAFENDPFAITVRLSAEGLDGQAIRVELHERDATGAGAGRMVASRSVIVPAGGTVDPITFERRREQVGRVIYTVYVPVLEAESVSEDNSRQSTVNVIDAQTRVLIIAGEPSWEYRFVSRLLERDATFNVSCWLQSADLSAVRDGNTVIDHLPVLADELFEYDVIILMDPDAVEIDDAWCRLVDRFVTDYGGGVLFSAARPRTPATMRDPGTKALRDLLPVTIDPEADLVLNQIGHYQRKAAQMIVPAAALSHPAISQGDDPVADRLAWQGIGSIYWHYPVLREKPAATVLMRHGDPRMRNVHGHHVLAATQFVGAGRTGFLAFDGTWRWRRTSVSLFDRFWVKLTRHLGEGKLLGGSKRGMILTDSDTFSIGEAVNVTARLFNARYEPLVRPEVRARFSVDEERSELLLTSRSDRPGWYQGRFVPDRVGSYRIAIELPGADPSESVEIGREIRVSRPNLEIQRPQMNRAELVTLAEQSAGGRYFEVDEAAQVADLIPDLHAEIPIRSRPNSLWDNWRMLALLAGLLTVEWAMRKWYRML